MLITPERVEIVAGQSIHLQVTVYDEFGQALKGADVEWNTGDTVGAVDATGVFIATTRSGSYPRGITVTARLGSSTASVTIPVRVDPGPLTELAVSPTPLQVNASQSLAITVEGYDQFGNAIENMEVQATLSLAGRFDGRMLVASTVAGLYAEGVVVQASASGQQLSKRLAVVIMPGLPAKVIVDPGTLVVKAGSHISLDVTTVDEFGNTIPEAEILVTGSQSAEYGSNGTLVVEGPIQAGAYENSISISSTYLGTEVQEQLDLNVVAAELSTVQIIAASAPIFTGDPVDMNVEASDRFGNLIEGVTVTWSSPSNDVIPSGSSWLFTAGREAGTVPIAVTVSDGQATVEETFTIQVQQGSCETTKRRAIWEVEWNTFDPATGNGTGLVDKSSSTVIPGRDWGTGSIVAGRSDFLKMVAITRIVVRRHGPVSFIVGADNGYRIKINGELVPGLSNWSNHPYERRAAIVELVPGTYDLQLEYYERTGPARLYFDIDEDVLEWDEITECTGTFSQPPQNALWKTSESVIALLEKFGVSGESVSESMTIDSRHVLIRAPGDSRKVIVLQGLDSKASCIADVGRLSSTVGVDGVPVLRLNEGEWVQLYGLAAQISLITSAIHKENWESERRPSPVGLEDILGFSYQGEYQECGSGQGRITTSELPGTHVYPIYVSAQTCLGLKYGADQLQVLIERLAELEPEVRIDLIGHSMGGMIATYLMANKPALTRQFVRSLVTLDSPLLGYPDFDGVPFRPCADSAPSIQDISGNTRVVDTIRSLGITGQSRVVTSIVTSVGHALPGHQAIVRDCDAEEGIWGAVFGLLTGSWLWTLGLTILGDALESLDGHKCVWNDPVALDAMAHTVVSESKYIEPRVLDMKWLDRDGARVCRVGNHTEVFLHVAVRGYRDGTIQVPILDIDPFNPDDLSSFVEMDIVNGVGTAKWTAVWQSDGWLGFGGDPEFKFVVQNKDSRELKVQPSSQSPTQLCATAVIESYEFNEISPEAGSLAWVDVSITNNSSLAGTFGAAFFTRREFGQLTNNPNQTVSLNPGQSKSVRFVMNWGESGQRDIQFTVWDQVSDIMDTTGWIEDLVVVVPAK